MLGRLLPPTSTRKVTRVGDDRRVPYRNEWPKYPSSYHVCVCVFTYLHIRPNCRDSYDLFSFVIGCSWHFAKRLPFDSSIESAQLIEIGLSTGVLQQKEEHTLVAALHTINDVSNEGMTLVMDISQSYALRSLSLFLSELKWIEIGNEHEHGLNWND